jgi:predicted GNAT family acetyltransferase
MPVVRVRLVDDPAEFLAAAGPLLLADEPRHNLILGLAGTLRDHPDLYPEHQLWLVEHRGRPVAAALRTPPHGLVLARSASATALEALAGAIDDELPGVVAAVPEAGEFAEAWTARTGTSHRVRTRQGIYALEQALAPAGVPGAARAASRSDRDLLVRWWRAFALEALHDPDPDMSRIESSIDHRLGAEGSGLALWEDDGEPVSAAGFGGATPNGIRIGPVYTPPERRGRGYASALVASVSTQRLAEGRRFCFLYTDLANPVSNRIYERIGYEWVCEAAEVVFEPI